MSKAPNTRRKIGLSLDGPTHDAVVEQAAREERDISAVYERAARLYLRTLKRKQKATR